MEGMFLNRNHITFIYFICLADTVLTVKLQIQESEEKQFPQDLRKVPPAMRSQKAKTADSEKQSIGYETMTTVSDLDSEVSFRIFFLDIT